jgi:hypothetical protein
LIYHGEQLFFPIPRTLKDIIKNFPSFTSNNMSCFRCQSITDLLALPSFVVSYARLFHQGHVPALLKPTEDNVAQKPQESMWGLPQVGKPDDYSIMIEKQRPVPSSTSKNTPAERKVAQAAISVAPDIPAVSGSVYDTDAARWSHKQKGPSARTSTDGGSLHSTTVQPSSSRGHAVNPPPCPHRVVSP